MTPLTRGCVYTYIYIHIYYIYIYINVQLRKLQYIFYIHTLTSCLSMFSVFVCEVSEVVSIAYHMLCTCHRHNPPIVWLMWPRWKVCPISDTWSVCRRRSSHEPRSQTDPEWPPQEWPYSSVFCGQRCTLVVYLDDSFQNVLWKDVVHPDRM